ncbi:MAG: DUF4845 domain-containing protein [Gammaproteobacteria bacterium]|nr:DUF4845 domain-containing protein [Gammaproteobacteria bacterium]
MHKQHGLSMVSWLIVISFFGTIAISALNIIPSYLNYFSARSVLNSLESDAIVKGKSAEEIKTIISARFNTNNLRNINTSKSIVFKNRGASDRAGYKVILSYEDRGRIIGNLFFVTVFQHEVEITP